mmetsp:Transcript_37559/g.91290  ORF Transcript_37559/g.91290 Transcript_37559/m.91290 type:complete len:218 (+) Transcript_37559:935-1588(+)
MIRSILDGFIDGTSLGTSDGVKDGAIVGTAVVGTGVGAGVGAGVGTGVGSGVGPGGVGDTGMSVLPSTVGRGVGWGVGLQAQGSPGATDAVDWISRHSSCVNSKFRPRRSSSAHWAPPIVFVENVGIPSKQTLQKTVPDMLGADGPPTVGGPADGAVTGDDAGPGFDSKGQPHVLMANACAMPHCSRVKPVPNGPPTNCASPHVMAPEKSASPYNSA